MDGMRDGTSHGMHPTAVANGTGMPDMQPRHKMMMHMTFFWGHNALILFPGWPGTDSGMYALALVFIFVLSVLIEWLSHCNLAKDDGSNRVAAGLTRTLVHAVRVGLANMVMLAVMSFNVGVFVVVVAGHTLGFLFFGSRVFGKQLPPHSEKTSDLPPMSC